MARKVNLQNTILPLKKSSRYLLFNAAADEAYFCRAFADTAGRSQWDNVYGPFRSWRDVRSALATLRDA